VTQTASLLIVDRSADPLTPLLHEFTYQAMVCDLLDVKEGRYTYQYTDRGGKPVQKEVLLDESDPLWPSLRHKCGPGPRAVVLRV
jgi:syntaxin-binding protein 1